MSDAAKSSFKAATSPAVEPAEEQPVAQNENKNSPPTENAPAPVLSGSSGEAIGVRILLVEDHEPTRSALEYLLTWRHHRVFTAGTLAEARTIAGREKIDLVISDIGLPDGSGNDLMTELRERHGLKGIALTGYGMEHDIVSSRSAGFVTHMIKPIRMQALEAALAATMRS